MICDLTNSDTLYLCLGVPIMSRFCRARWRPAEVVIVLLEHLRLGGRGVGRRRSLILMTFHPILLRYDEPKRLLDDCSLIIKIN